MLSPCFTQQFLSLSFFSHSFLSLPSLFLIPSLSRHCQASLSLWITKPLSPSLTFLSESPSRCHQASPECRFSLTHLQIPLPIHSSHKPNTLDTHLTFHSITLSSNRDSQGFSRFCGFGLKFCLQNLKWSSVSLSNQIKIKIKAIY